MSMEVIWKVLKGKWVDAGERDDLGYEEIGGICLLKPETEKEKVFKLTSAKGKRLLERFCTVDSVKSLCKFLNHWGSLDVAEPSASNDRTPFTNQMTLIRDGDIRYVIYAPEVQQMLKTAKYLRWLRRYIFAVNNVSVDQDSFFKFFELDPVTKKIGKYHLGGPQFLNVIAEAQETILDINGSTVGGSYELPSSTFPTLEQLMVEEKFFFIKSARQFATGQLLTVASQITQSIDEAFRPALQATNPRQAIFAAMLEEAAKVMSDNLNCRLATVCGSSSARIGTVRLGQRPKLNTKHR